MAKLPRVFQKVFGSSAVNNGVFGSAAAGSPTISNVLSTIMSLGAWLTGWSTATLSGRNLPTLEEMNGVQYVNTSQLAYLFQEGIPEYDSATTYFMNSIVKKAGTYQIYGSLIDNNVGNALTIGADWDFLCDLSAVANQYYGVAGGTANALTFTPSNPVATLVAGLSFIGTPSTSNTSTAITIAVSGLTATAAKKSNGSGIVVPAIGDLVANVPALFFYDGTQFLIMTIRPNGYATAIAAATTLNLDTTNADYVFINAAGTITGITLAQGQERKLLLASGVVFTNGASLLTLTGANISSQAGDTCTVRGETGGTVRMTQYQKFDGTALAAATVGNLKNFKLTNNTATPNTKVDYSWDSGIIGSTTGASGFYMTATTGTIDCTTTGINGLDTGALAASTAYYVYATQNPTTLAKGMFASTSATAPTVPAGYVALYKVGRFITSAASTIRGFTQINEKWRYKVGVNLAALPIMSTGVTGSVTVPTWTNISTATFAPPDATSIAVVAVGSGASAGVAVAPNASYGAHNSASNAPPIFTQTDTSGNQFSNNICDVLLETTAIQVACVVGGQVYCAGFNVPI